MSVKCTDDDTPEQSKQGNSLEGEHKEDELKAGERVTITMCQLSPELNDRDGILLKQNGARWTVLLDDGRRFVVLARNLININEKAKPDLPKHHSRFRKIRRRRAKEAHVQSAARDSQKRETTHDGVFLFSRQSSTGSGERGDDDSDDETKSRALKKRKGRQLKDRLAQIKARRASRKRFAVTDKTSSKGISELKPLEGGELECELDEDEANRKYEYYRNLILSQADNRDQLNEETLQKKIIEMAIKEIDKDPFSQDFRGCYGRISKPVTNVSGNGTSAGTEDEREAQKDDGFSGFQD